MSGDKEVFIEKAEFGVNVYCKGRDPDLLLRCLIRQQHKSSNLLYTTLFHLQLFFTVVSFWLVEWKEAIHQKIFSPVEVRNSEILTIAFA